MSNIYDEILKRAEEAFGTYKVDYTEYSKKNKRRMFTSKKLYSMIRLQSYYGLMARRPL